MVRRRSSVNVELNVTAMLDMAFQLLAFFVLTFKAAPKELAFKMHLPPAGAVVNDQSTIEPGTVARLTPFVPEGLKTLRVDLFSNSGGIDRITVNDVPAESLADLQTKMTALARAPGSPLEQVVVQASDRLNYANIMQVVGICAELEPEGAEHLVKLRLLARGDSPGL